MLIVCATHLNNTVDRGYLTLELYNTWIKEKCDDLHKKKINQFFYSGKQQHFGSQKFISYNKVLETNLCTETGINTHPSLIIRPWFWMKSLASSGLLNINIRTMSSRGNAVDRGPTVCARFKVCKAFALTCVGCTYTKLLMIPLLRHVKAHENM